jgi:molybdate transport system ATP-binding protein
VPAHGAVFAATVSEHRADGLTALAFDGGELLVPLLDRPLHAKLRVRLHADDVILACERPRQISANNVLPVRVAAARAQSGTHAEIHLDCGGARFVARITHASFDRLALHAGQNLFAIVKSVAIDPQTSRISNGTD